MNIVLKSSITTLQKSINLLNALSDDTLSNTSIPPYYSCIGSHIRHILDFYDCILVGLPTNEVDLTSRKRDEKMHCDCNYASKNVTRVIGVARVSAGHFWPPLTCLRTTVIGDCAVWSTFPGMGQTIPAFPSTKPGIV